MTDFLSSFTALPTYSVQNGSPAAAMTPGATVMEGGHGGGRMLTSTKVAMGIVPLIFFLLVLAFCLVARRSTEQPQPVLPIRRPPMAYSYDKRESVERWRERVSQQDIASPTCPSYPHPPPSPICRRSSLSSLSGETIVDMPRQNPYLPQPPELIQLPPPAYRADHPHTFTGIP